MSPRTAKPIIRMGDTYPGKLFDAQLLSIRDADELVVPAHGHDFYELMFVRDGQGDHQVSGSSRQLTPGSLLLAGPTTTHSIRVPGGAPLTLFSIAVPTATWDGFTTLIGQADSFQPVGRGGLVAAQLHGYCQRECLLAFERLMNVARLPSAAELVRFLLDTTGYLLENRTSPAGGSARPEAPVWLRRAVSAMTDIENLRAGVPGLVKLSCVTSQHLSRSVRRYYGQTPTELVNELRLRRAALLLRATSVPIGDVAYDCGFASLSYFYRVFARTFGRTPRSLRLAAGSDEPHPTASPPDHGRSTADRAQRSSQDKPKLTRGQDSLPDGGDNRAKETTTPEGRERSDADTR